MIDMLALLPEYEQDRFDSRHRLVIAASQRAKHLIQGARPAAASKFTKETAVAIDEVLQAKVEFLVGKEARQAIKAAKRGKDSEAERLAMVDSAEDAHEIKKELSVYVDDSAGKGSEGEGEE
jgi:DNA-directed RNA polymerase subunit omega